MTKRAHLLSALLTCRQIIMGLEVDKDYAFEPYATKATTSPYGGVHMLLRGLEKVKAEIKLSVLAYNIKRVIRIVGVKDLVAALA